MILIAFSNVDYSNMTRSPAKKQMLVSLTSAQTTTHTSISRGNSYSNNKLTNDIVVIGKSVENVYEKVIYFIWL